MTQLQLPATEPTLFGHIWSISVFQKREFTPNLKFGVATPLPLRINAIR